MEQRQDSVTLRFCPLSVWAVWKETLSWFTKNLKDLSEYGQASTLVAVSWQPWESSSFPVAYSFSFSGAFTLSDRRIKHWVCEHVPLWKGGASAEHDPRVQFGVKRKITAELSYPYLEQKTTRLLEMFSSHYTTFSKVLYFTFCCFYNFNFYKYITEKSKNFQLALKKGWHCYNVSYKDLSL